MTTATSPTAILMASTSRSAQFVKLHKVLKKHYSPVTPNAERPVLEHLLFASCLENAHHNTAEEAFAALVEAFFDWNEIRVSTVRELSEVMAHLPDPPAAANRLKRILQSVFEASYSFDLEELRKMNLGPAIGRIKKTNGSTPFSVSYVVQSALGGHSIPLSSGVLEALRVVDLITEKEAKSSSISGLERAIAKSKGIEFGSLLHQLGADFTANPYAPALRAILLEINPAAKARLPKRRTRKQREADAQKAAEAEKVKQEEEAARKAAAKAKAAAAENKKAARKSKKKAKTQKPEKTSAKEKPAAKEKTPARKKAAPGQKKTKRLSESTAKRSPSVKLSKRKPR